MSSAQRPMTLPDALGLAQDLRFYSFEVCPFEVGDLVRAAGSPGHRLLWRDELCLLGVGEALRLPLGPPWGSPRNTALVNQVLSSVRLREPLAGPTSLPRPSTPGRPGPTPGRVPGSRHAVDLPEGRPDEGPPASGPLPASRRAEDKLVAGCPPPRLPAGPVAMGALPYDPGRAGYLVVPEVLVAKSPDAARVTLVTSKGRPVPDIETVLAFLRRLSAEPARAVPPDSFTLTASMPHEAWKSLVARTVQAISRGELAKVVLARCVEVSANRPFVLHEALARLAALYPSCAVFHYEGFIGASPEILIRRTGERVLSHPLAGTVAHSGDQSTDQAALANLLASPKTRHEHQLVVDAVAGRLRPYCSQLEVPPQPSVVALRNVSHLGSALRGTLRSPAAPTPGSGGADQAGSQQPPPPWHDGTSASVADRSRPSLTAGSPVAGNGSSLPSALDLAALLQPTPAVGGNPTEAAIEWQRSTEGFDRGWYAGPLGWVDATGDGEWVLGLRSARVLGERAWLYAGNGIVAGSDPDSELAETQLKLQALLAALVRP